MDLPWRRRSATTDPTTSTTGAAPGEPGAPPRVPVAGEAEEARAGSPGRALAPGAVPPGMLVAGAWGWRLLVVAACLAVLGWLVSRLEEIVVPLLIDTARVLFAVAVFYTVSGPVMTLWGRAAHRLCTVPARHRSRGRCAPRRPARCAWALPRDRVRALR